MAAPRPYDAPPPYTDVQPPIGFTAPNQPPTVKVDVQQNPGYGQGPPYGQMQPQPTYVYPQAQGQGSVHVVTTQPQVIGQRVIVVPGASCPNCRAGLLRNEFTCCGIFLGICFFPIGMLCCFLMMEKRCTNCHMTYGSSM